MKKKFLLLLSATWLMMFFISPSWACTSIIVSGKATPDGRPLMWKHRDTSTPYNHIVFVNDPGKLSYMGLINSDESDKGIWIGTNEAGFSIMNTASYNLKNDTITVMDHEGKLMREALKVCRTIADFERFLDTLSRPMRVEANFGVIDAFGGAAYYETDNWKYIKKDVNDPALAPKGYLVYTNFSTEGRKEEGYGYIRYNTATALFAGMKKEEFTPQRIFQNLSRSFWNSFLGIDLKTKEFDPNRRTGWFVEQDFIPRRESTASIVIQGVKPGTNPDLTTMWAALGYPPAAVAVPLWLKMGAAQPAEVLYNETVKTAPLCRYSSDLRDKLYPIHYGNGQKYLHWALLYNDAGTGYMQTVEKAENRVFELYDAHQKAIEKGGKLNPGEVTALYKAIFPIVEQTYRSIQ